MSTFIGHYFKTVSAYMHAIPFIREHRLWNGFNKHPLVLVALIAAGIVLSIKMYDVIAVWWTGSLDMLGGEDATSEEGGLSFSLTGGYKYVILILMELFIFHIAIRTNELVTGEQTALTLRTFLGAQIRMIRVTVFVFFMELVASLILGILLSVIGFEWLKPLLLFCLQCFFLGFALIDNYYEINGLGIKESYAEAKSMPGVSFGIGLGVYLLILIPFLGPLLGPAIAAVAATLVLCAIEENKKVSTLIQETI